MEQLKQAIQYHSNPVKAKLLARYFKTGKGEYGEGDIFLGLTVPESRKIAKQFSSISLNELKYHLQSKFHEERLIALLILVDKYQKTKSKEIVDFYLSNTKSINNWDLVDLTSHKILGNYLLDKDKSILFKLTNSENIWERRIAIISTFAFISQNNFKDSLKIAEILINDKHDLIHKAVGWMLREIGKRNQPVLENFLKQKYKKMPRTMLRYAIEKFPEAIRKKYLKGEI